LLGGRRRGLCVKAPLIKECCANLACKLVDAKLVPTYNFFIFEVVQARAATSPKNLRTLHDRGNGAFMMSGREVTLAQCSRRKTCSAAGKLKSATADRG